MSEENVIIILDNATLKEIGRIYDAENAYIHERVNDKYTFEFTCYAQDGTELLNNNPLIFVDDDYFEIAQIQEMPVLNKFEVLCEHVSYELNAGRDDEINAVYVGTPMEIANQILADNNTRIRCTYSDAPQVITFKTKIGPVRSRLIELAQSIGFVVIFRKLELSIVRRRGHDYGLEIELGKNLKDVTITKNFNFDGTVTQAIDIDFIDLNKLVDENGEPLEVFEFHLGDTVYLKFRDEVIAQRGISVGYNPFRRELPTIELDSPVRGITEVISGGITHGSQSVYYMEHETLAYSNIMIFELEQKYSEIVSITTGIIGIATDGHVTLLANPIQSNGKYTSVVVFPVEDGFNSNLNVSVQVIGRL